jgi:hypothetical protein
MKAVFNGSSTSTSGKQPKKPTTWWGTVTAIGSNGDASEVKWRSDRPLSYREAMESVGLAMDEAEGSYAETYQRTPDRVTFSIECR